MSTSENYPFDETELRRRFPADVAVPDLLVAFGHWMKSKPYDSIGDIYFDYNYADQIAGAGNHAQIIKFLGGDNFSAFFWRHDAASQDMPVVIQDSEGGSDVIPNLAAFIARFATGYYGTEFSDRFFCYNSVPRRVQEAEYFEDHDDPESLAEHEAEIADMAPDLRLELGDWLLSYTGAKSLDALINADTKTPDFSAWQNTQEHTRNKALIEHPSTQAIADLMRGDCMHVVWVDDYYRVVVGKKGTHVPPFRDLPEAEALKPHIKVLREDWAKTYTGLGLWHSATFQTCGTLVDIMSAVTSYLDDRSLLQKTWDGLRGKKPPSLLDELGEYETETPHIDLPVNFSPNYEHIYPGELGEDLPETADFKADQARFPRAPHRISKWLQERLFNE